MKEITIELPTYENVQSGTYIETKWETSDGIQFENKNSAQSHEFYLTVVKKRGHDLPVNRVQLFDFRELSDLEKYEKDFMGSKHIIMYDKNTLTFPNTYVTYETHLYGNDEETNDFSYDPWEEDHRIYTYFVTLDEYKRLLIDSVNNLS